MQSKNAIDKSKWISHIYHVDLSDHGHLSKEKIWLQASGARHALVLHNEKTRTIARKTAPFLKDVPDANLTHYTETQVKLPYDQAVRVHIKHTLNHQENWKGDHAASHAYLTIPPVPLIVPPPPGADPLPPVHHFIDWIGTAKALIFHHPDLITHNPEIAQIIFDYMSQEKQQDIFDLISNAKGDGFADVMRSLGPPTPTSGWAIQDPVTVTNKSTDKTTTTYDLQPVPKTIEAGRAVFTAMMIATKNDLQLKNKKWTQAIGQSTAESIGGTPGSSPAPDLPLADVNLIQGDDFVPILQITGEQYGTEIIINSHGQNPDGTDFVNLTVKNKFIRYLGVYVSFYGAEDNDQNPMSIPDWTVDGGDPFGELVKKLNLEYDYMKYAGFLSPMNNLFAIPIGPPGSTTFTITFPSTKNGYPKDAVRARIFACGLGVGDNSYPKTNLVGALFTGFVNLGIPAFMLGFGVASQAYGPLYKIISENNLKIISGAVKFLIRLESNAAFFHKVSWSAFTGFAKILFSAGAVKALAWCEAEMAGEEAAEEIPFAGWIIVALNIATGIAQLAETIVEILESPFHIDNTITGQITSKVTVHPDPQHKAWPQAPVGSKISCLCKMIFKSQNRPSVAQRFEVPANFTAKTILFTFPKNTLGGEVKFEVDYYIDNWIAARAITQYLPNDQVHTDNVPIYLVQIPVPINKNTIFSHASILTYQDNAYAWMETSKAPTATIIDLDASNSGNAISLLTNLSLSQRFGTIGISYKSFGTGLSDCVSGSDNTQLYAFQNVDIPGRPMANAKFTDCGFLGAAALVYDPYPPKFLMKNGEWVLDKKGRPIPDPSALNLGDYFIDPRLSNNPLEEDGGYHLRKISVTGTGNINPGNPNNLKSYGRFPFFPDHVAIHPANFAVGISTKHGKIMITELFDGVENDALPVARLYAGTAQNAERNGLLFQPLGVTCSYDGTILILDQLNSAQGSEARVQAFDFLGRPVQSFTNAQGAPTSILNIPTDVNYLDIQAVGNQHSTYILLLYYEGIGNDVSDYHVAIYNYGTKIKNAELVLTVDDIPAARLMIDMWHTMYALNYEMTTDGAGKPAGPMGSNTGPAGRTVPSVSEWLPSIPKG